MTPKISPIKLNVKWRMRTVPSCTASANDAASRLWVKKQHQHRITKAISTTANTNWLSTNNTVISTEKHRTTPHHTAPHHTTRTTQYNSDTEEKRRLITIATAAIHGNTRE